ncbi:M48 family peptidase [candidate division KSB1 bacterium]|nr:M48 family metallopeptidase [candidate division KSB1 bacterium]RQW00166.1 MAG: M48 family peptidase [candidate division KSB1 bacterium]
MSIKSFSKTIPGIGRVLFERSKKAKHLNITVKPIEGIRVAVPFGLSYQQAEDVVKSKRKWLEEQMLKIRAIQEEYKARQQEKPGIDRKEARVTIVKRLEELARRHNFSYKRVFIRSQKTKWGSCSGSQNINLNVKLVELPEELMDYVILHELVHLKVKNHGPEFWATLDQYVGGDAKKINRELKKYRLDV